MLRTIRITVFVLACLVLVNCSTPKAASKSPVLDGLFAAAASAEKTEAHTALLLLSHVAMGEEEYKRLVHDFNTTKDPMRKLLLAYVIDSRFQLLEYKNAFVDLFPTGADWALIWNMETNYPSMPPPLQDHLAWAAKTNLKAIDKLVSAVPFADGAYAEALVHEIQEVFKYQPKAVRDALMKFNVQPSRVRIPNE